MPTKCQRPWNQFGIQTSGYLATRDLHGWMTTVTQTDVVKKNPQKQTHPKHQKKRKIHFFICLFPKLVMHKKADVFQVVLKRANMEEGMTIFHQPVATGWWAQGTAKASWHRFWRLVAMHRKLSNCYSAWCEAWWSYTQWCSEWEMTFGVVLDIEN